MTAQRGVGWDYLGAVGVLVVVAVTTGYVRLLGRHGNQPVTWFLGGLVGSALLGGYGAVRTPPLRGTALAIAGGILVVLGIMGLLSVGLPILAAGVLILIAAARSAGCSAIRLQR